MIETQKKIFSQKQEREFADIYNFLGYNTRFTVENLKTVSNIWANGKTRFRSTRIAMIRYFDCRYQDIAKSDCEKVIDFVNKLRQA